MNEQQVSRARVKFKPLTKNSPHVDYFHTPSFYFIFSLFCFCFSDDRTAHFPLCVWYLLPISLHILLAWEKKFTFSTISKKLYFVFFSHKQFKSKIKEFLLLLVVGYFLLFLFNKRVDKGTHTHTHSHAQNCKLRAWNSTWAFISRITSPPPTATTTTHCSPPLYFSSSWRGLCDNATLIWIHIRYRVI